MLTLIPVILAGGEGKGLWPLSSSESPKQFLRMGKNGESLFASAYKRAMMIAPPDNIIIVTRKSLSQQVYREVCAVDKGSEPSIILEPYSRNTAAAISVAAFHALQKFENPVLWVMPSDNYIERPFTLINAVQEYAVVTERSHIITFGIKPSSKECNYAHMLYGNELSGYDNLYNVKFFLEKPQGERLKWFIQHKNCLWHSGMFMFSARSILHNIRMKNKLIADYASEAYKNSELNRFGLALGSIYYRNMPSISIDKLVMENNENLLVKPLDIGWSDIGSWMDVWELSQNMGGTSAPLQNFLYQIQNAA